MESLLQQFAGGQGGNMEGSQLLGSVAQMLGGASNEHSQGATHEAINKLGPHGFGQSVAQGAQQASQEQRNGLANTLLSAVSQGGGSPDKALAALGINNNSMEGKALGLLAEHVAANHPNALASVLGSQLSGSSGGNTSMLGMLGNPMVQHLGTQLAQRML